MEGDEFEGVVAEPYGSVVVSWSGVLRFLSQRVKAAPDRHVARVSTTNTVRYGRSLEETGCVMSYLPGPTLQLFLLNPGNMSLLLLSIPSPLINYICTYWE